MLGHMTAEICWRRRRRERRIDRPLLVVSAEPRMVRGLVDVHGACGWIPSGDEQPLSGIADALLAEHMEERLAQRIRAVLRARDPTHRARFPQEPVHHWAVVLPEDCRALSLVEREDVGRAHSHREANGD